MGTIMISPMSDVDRISNLPDHIVHHIASFLNVLELAKLSLTSKMLRELCMSVPFLTFDGMRWRNRYKRLRFINSVDRFLALRKGKQTRRLSICWPLSAVKAYEKFRVVTWLYNAIACEVQLLDLEFILKGNEVFSLPLLVFHCESLKELKVNLNGGILDKFPPSGGFCNLKSLSLNDLKLSNEDFGEWISSFCKHLEKLTLRKIHGVANINISSSTLGSLIIETCCYNYLSSISISAEMLSDFILDWKACIWTGSSLKIFAPNLVNLRWDGHLVNLHCLEKLKHLKRSAINLSIDPSFPWYERSTNQNLSMLLNSICMSGALFLTNEGIKNLFKKGFLPYPFHNLSCLSLHANDLNDDWVPALACLLKGTPKLKSLHIKRYNIPAKQVKYSQSTMHVFTIRYWESEKLAFVHQLEEATIQLFHRGDNDLELAKFFLKHAKALKKMTIFYSTFFSPPILRLVGDDGKASTAEIVYFPSPLCNMENYYQ